MPNNIQDRVRRLKDRLEKVEESLTKLNAYEPNYRFKIIGPDDAVLIDFRYKWVAARLAEHAEQLRKRISDLESGFQKLMRDEVNDEV